MLTRYKAIAEDLNNGKEVKLISYNIDAFMTYLNHFISVEVNVKSNGNEHILSI